MIRLCMQLLALNVVCRATHSLREAGFCTFAPRLQDWKLVYTLFLQAWPTHIHHIHSFPTSFHLQDETVVETKEDEIRTAQQGQKDSNWAVLTIGQVTPDDISCLRTTSGRILFFLMLCETEMLVVHPFSANVLYCNDQPNNAAAKAQRP